MTAPVSVTLPPRLGMDARSMPGPLAARLDAVRGAGFSQVMLWASDLVGERGHAEALETVRASGLGVTGLQLLRDADGLGDGPSRQHKQAQADALLRMCVDLGSPMLLVCSNVSPGSRTDRPSIVGDLRDLARRAADHGVKLAYEALSWGHAVRDVEMAWQVVEEVDQPGFGLAVDSLHLLAAGTRAQALERLDAGKVFLLQLSDCLTRDLAEPSDRLHVARHARVFPGEGLHGGEVASYVRALAAAGYDGPCSFEVFHDDFASLPAAAIAQRASRAAAWLAQAFDGSS